MMVAVGFAEPALADPSVPIPDGPPEELVTLGPLHMSEDTVAGEKECARFFPPGYSEPEPKPKTKSKKKKKVFIFRICLFQRFYNTSAYFCVKKQ